MMHTADRIMFIAWAPYGRRTESLSRKLGIEPRFVHYLKFQNPVYAPFKYILQTFRTLQVLFTECPKVVFVQSPPFICGLVVDFYCRLTGSRFALDHHSASFGQIWDWALPFQKYLARRAVTNIVTNQHWAEILEAWPAHAFVLPDPYIDFPAGESFPMREGFNLMLVNTFADDEPLDEVLKAAAELPDVNFYITGNKKKKPDSFFVNLPPNVTFTGFLSDAKYIGLLRASDAVMSLTTRNFTLQSGGCEAVSVGKPLITSDWSYLRELFAKGTMYVPNTSDGIRDGIRLMKEKYLELGKEVAVFRREGDQEWNGRFSQLRELISGSDRSERKSPVVANE